MDHKTAVQLRAAERYLLEELSPEERDNFEEHYFMCVECADEVRSAFTFADNAKAVLASSPAPGAQRPRGWFSWWNLSYAAPIAAALLLAVTLYQSFLVIPRLERNLDNATTPRALPSVVARAATRGEDAVVRLSTQDPFVQVILDINSGVPVSSYTCEVRDESGTLKFSVPASVPAGTGSLNLLLPASQLKPGRYTITIGAAGTSSAAASDKYSFVVQR